MSKFINLLLCINLSNISEKSLWWCVEATSGLPRSGKKVWKMKFFPGQGKVREFGFESGKIGKSAKVREKSGNFKIFSKGMVFGNV